MTVGANPKSDSNRALWRLSRVFSIHGAARTSAEEISQSTFLIGTVVVVFGLIGLCAMLIWAKGLTFNATTAGSNVWTVLGCDTLVAGAAAAVGGLLGFVFGIPRTLDPAGRAAVATAASQGDAAVRSQAALSANTNLERISDWFTTLLIGATLVQVKDVAGWIEGIGHELASDKLSNDHIIPFVVIYFSVLSFIGVYLVTRLYLTFALQQTFFLSAAPNDDYPIQRLKADVSDALATGNPPDLLRVYEEYNGWKFQDNDLNDPGLNYILAQMLARVLQAGLADARRDDTIRKLNDAVQRAIATPSVKRQLAEDMGNRQLTTGIAEVDAALRARVTAT